ncbi:MAG: hypothetical protein SH817_11900 [Leptospira sp.]|nr:hypothetical protein [Leptospira sp.]
MPRADEHLKNSDSKQSFDYCTKIPFIDGEYADPLKNHSIVYKKEEINTPLIDGSVLVHYPEKNNYYPGEKIIYHAYIINTRGIKNKVNPLYVSINETNNGKLKELQRIEMFDTGGSYDIANDFIYTASFDTALLQKDPYNYQIQILYNEETLNLIASNSINYGSLNISLLPKSFKEKLLKNDMALNFEVEVAKTGTYYFSGSLYTASGLPIGNSQITSVLQKGKHNLSLRWHRSLFCDQDIKGKLVLKYFAFANTTEMPGPKSLRYDHLWSSKTLNWKKKYCLPKK